MFLNDIDSQFIKCLNYLYSSDLLVKGDPVPLQFFLEEAIKNKNGVTKDLTSLVSAAIKQHRIGEFKPLINAIEESKGSNSDNDLELDLLKEDLMCVVCNGMDVGARNRLLECSDCHALYHQECHTPIVTNQDSFDSWVCQSCKDAKQVEIPIIPIVAVVPAPVSNPKASVTVTKSSSSHRHSGNSYKPNSSKSEKCLKSNSSSTKSSNSSKQASNSRNNITPNINIISADKRIQIMKKKAAKLQEKRKHLSR